jgi:hypothetical protein
MRPILTATLLVLASTLLSQARAGDEEAGENTLPRVFCIAFLKDGDAGSATVQKGWLKKLETDLAERDVLFLHADLTSAGTRHQARLLMTQIALEGVWRDHANRPGTVALVDAEWGTVKHVLDARTTEAQARAGIEAMLAPAPAEDDRGDPDADK